MKVFYRKDGTFQVRGGSTADRILARIEERPNGCIEFTGTKNWAGYGGLSHKSGRRIAVHRFMWEYAYGRQIPEGFHIDHLCRNHSCVNPLHLEPVTPKENSLRGISIWAQNARKTHCPVGHAYDEANTKVWKNLRYCRACDARRQREIRARKRASR